MTLLNSTYFTCPRRAIVSVLLWTPKSPSKILWSVAGREGTCSAFLSYIQILGATLPYDI